MDKQRLLKERNYLNRFVSLTAPGNSEPLLLGEKVFNVACYLEIVGAGSGRVQYTFDDHSDVLDGVANWLDWPLGDVSISTEQVAQSAPQAFRLVCASGDNVTLKIRCNRGS